uniref:Uncharacterized protein n=1 Tax=Electrophorus electricus TaxID=8005 RepID=A0A4W4EB11_ELEEL
GIATPLSYFHLTALFYCGKAIYSPLRHKRGRISFRERYCKHYMINVQISAPPLTACCPASPRKITTEL